MLREPRDGVPAPITDVHRLADFVSGLRNVHGTGSTGSAVALDAERASGYRYSQRAYLVQVRHPQVGTALIDPIELPDLRTVDAAIGEAEWVLHAADQDLPCLADLGMRPRRLFDTELAGRLLGEERVSLGTMVEQHLGVRLEKGHSAADWSTRPLPHDWLAYAALDVELLIELRERLATALRAAGKLEWAQQEFEAIRLAPPNAPRAEPWRRTSGIHRLRSRRQLAAVRELWLTRDRYAAQRDVAPGRTLPDSAVIDAASTNPASLAELVALPVFGGPRQRRRAGMWFAALERARRLADNALPQITAGSIDGMPAASRWRERDPDAAARLAAARRVITTLATEHSVLAQNLLPSDIVRRLCWQPPEPIDADAVRTRLAELGARPWQIELTAAPLADALRAL